jgi:hypothetical protein
MISLDSGRVSSNSNRSAFGGLAPQVPKGSAASLSQDSARRSAGSFSAEQVTQLLEVLQQLQRALAAFAELSLPGGGAATPGKSTTAPGQPLRRLFASDYGDGKGSPAGADRPSERAISNAVSRADEGKLNKAGASDLFWLWGQFLDHDIDLSTPSDEPLSIKVPKGDATFDFTGQGDQTLRTHRSNAVQGVGGTRQQLNTITALIDASNVYGSTPEQTQSLRSFEGGTLRASENGYMPRSERGFFQAGDARANENIGLTAMHTLFMREHNRVADALSSENPSWSDEQVFTEARAQVTALVQSITVNEFLPLLFGGDALGAYEGPQAGLDGQISNAFSSAAYRFGHSMVSDTLNLRNADGTLVDGKPMALSDAFFRPDTFDRVGVDAILRGMASNTAQAMDPEIVNSLRNLVMDGPGAPRLDLAALNIARGRDHGLPTLNQARAAFGMPEIKSFDDPAFRDGVGARLAQVYDSPDDIDLWVGLLAEAPQGEGLVGPTQRAILVEQFTRLRDADPNWYANTMDAGEVAALDKTRLSDVIRRNSGVGNVQSNAMLARPLAV